MRENQKNEGRQFALELLDEMKSGAIVKACMGNHSDDFTGGMENLHRERFRQYLGSCGCYLMDLRLRESEEAYHG